MTEKPTFFENQQGQRLFAMLHTGAEDATWGVVFCHPLEEEKHASYRIIVEFARALAASGIPTINFDCRGFGNSGEDMIDTTVKTQIADVQSAMSRLTEESGVTRFVLIGLRLGACIANLVANRDERVSALVLISPIISGKRYFDQIITSQRMFFMTLGVQAPKKSDLLEQLNQQGSLEVKAESLSDSFLEQISDIDLRHYVDGYRGPHLISASPADKANLNDILDLVAVHQKAGTVLTQWLEEPSPFWTPKVPYSGVLPTGFYSKVIHWLKELNL